jgi:hypothetical protein
MILARESAGSQRQLPTRDKSTARHYNFVSKLFKRAPHAHDAVDLRCKKEQKSLSGCFSLNARAATLQSRA